MLHNHPGLLRGTLTVSYETKRTCRNFPRLPFIRKTCPAWHCDRLGEWVVEELLKVFHFMLHNHPGLLRLAFDALL